LGALKARFIARPSFRGQDVLPDTEAHTGEKGSLLSLDILCWRRSFDPSDSPKTILAMFSHVVIFWTDPTIPTAADELIAGAEHYLRPIPGVLSFHVGRMATSHRPVVDQTYQVALSLVFPDKETQDDYQAHPMHIEFVEKVFKRVCKRVVVYDFE
jgi:hypothetical protein